MALKFRLKSKDEIPAGLESHYVERDGVWILDADGAADKSKLDEFRNTNVALCKERDDTDGCLLRRGAAAAYPAVALQLCLEVFNLEPNRPTDFVEWDEPPLHVIVHRARRYLQPRGHIGFC
jgi:hypothetical protein